MFSHAFPSACRVRIQIQESKTNLKRNNSYLDLPDGPMVKKLLPNAGDRGSIPGLERFHMLGRTLGEKGNSAWGWAVRLWESAFLLGKQWDNEAWVPQLLRQLSRACGPKHRKPPRWEVHTPQPVAPARCQLEKVHTQQQRPRPAKNK